MKTPFTKKNEQGFTLVELLVVMGILAILAAIALVALNPTRHFAEARNTQRVSNVNTILNAISENMAENRGVFSCEVTVPTTMTKIAGIGGYNLAACVVPDYLSSLPFDPKTSGARWNNDADYDTGYSIVRNDTTGQIKIIATGAELGVTIAAER